MAAQHSRQEILNEVEETLGLVPGWVESQPEQALDGFWTLFRDYYLAETKIPNKYKELIGLGVSGATKCRYCALFHTEAARLYGATDEEISEACMMGAVTMLGSTYLNAMQIDYEQFKRETQEVVSYIRAHADGRAQVSTEAEPQGTIGEQPEPPQPHA